MPGKKRSSQNQKFTLKFEYIVIIVFILVGLLINFVSQTTTPSSTSSIGINDTSANQLKLAPAQNAHVPLNAISADIANKSLHNQNY